MFVGQDGADRAGKVPGDVLEQDIAGDGAFLGVHDGALAVGTDPDHALAQVVIQEVNADVPVNGLRLVFAERFKAEKAVLLEAHEEVLVERDDARDIAVFLDQG